MIARDSEYKGLVHTLKLSYLFLILPDRRSLVRQLDGIHRTLWPLNLSPF